MRAGPESPCGSFVVVQGVLAGIGAVEGPGVLVGPYEGVTGGMVPPIPQGRQSDRGRRRDEAPPRARMPRSKPVTSTIS